MSRVRLEVMLGSVRPQRVAPVVADWFVDHARRHPDFDTGTLDLADFALPNDLAETTGTQEFRHRLAAADAFVAITPEYNHGYSGALKTAFDSAKHEWRAKPIGFVSYGGLSGGLRATEQLRAVVAELHMVSVRETVSFHDVKHRFDAADPIAADAAARLLEQLAWWAKALAPHRDSYPGSRRR